MAHRFEPEILEEEWYIIDVFGGLRRKMSPRRDPIEVWNDL
jgi:hypothetical protein